MTFNNHQIIFGAPGCGKTTRLFGIIQELLSSYVPEEIAFVSFTKAAVEEAKSRLATLEGYDAKRFCHFRTLHSMCFNLLNLRSSDLMSTKNYQTFSRSLGLRFSGKYSPDLDNSDDKYLHYLSLKNNNPAEFDRALANDDFINMRKFKRIEYQFGEYKKFSGTITFDDMIMKALETGIQCPAKIAIIDEAQDLTTLQWRLCFSLFHGADKVYIAGDDEQAIYTWSGADVARFISLHKSNDIILSHSYRMTKAIYDFSKKISANIGTRVKKEFTPVGDGGSVEFCNHVNEISLVAGESYLFLSRTNYYLFYHYDYLRSLPEMYYDHKTGSSSVQEELIEAIYHYTRLSNISLSKTDFNNAVGVGVQKYLKKSFDHKMPWYDSFDLDHGVKLYLRDLIKNKKHKDASNGLSVGTVHRVKGMEADNVVLCLDITRNVENSLLFNRDNEMRVLYVASTRARKKLYLVNSNSKFSYNIKEIIG